MLLQCKTAIIEDDIMLADTLARYLTGLGKFEIAGIAHDGEQGIRLLRSCPVDVALIDLVLPRKDGFYILDELSKKPEPKPCFIMISGMGHSRISQKAIEKGADYFISKPFDLDFLALRIYEVRAWKRLTEDENSLADQITLKIPEAYVTQVMRELPIPITQEGYAYIKTALLLSINQPKMLNKVTKDLYPAVAQEHGVDASQAERSMRYAISTAWRKGGGMIFAYLLGQDKTDMPRPSVSAFLMALVEKYQEM